MGGAEMLWWVYVWFLLTFIGTIMLRILGIEPRPAAAKGGDDNAV